MDVVVGTHRMLQKDVKFHDLGLVIKMCIRDRALRAPHIKPETGAFVHGERSNNSIPAAPGGI